MKKDVIHVTQSDQNKAGTESLPKKEADKKPVVEKPAPVKVEKKQEEKSINNVEPTICTI